MKNLKDLTVVVLSYNTKKILEDCLESVFLNTSKLDYEIIIVDNASSDGSCKLLEKLVKKHKNLKVIFNKTNVGFSQGNNQGMARVKSRYILLLNSDTKLTENSFKKMVEWMDNNPGVGAASCQLINPDGSFQVTGGNFPTLGRVFLWATFIDDLPFVAKFTGSYHPKPEAFMSTVHDQDWITGAFFLTRPEVVEKVGGLDEKIFMYGEDVEYCYRIRQAGWRVAFVPITKIIHIGGASGIGTNTVIGEFKGLVYFYKKHRGSMEQIALNFLLKTASILRLIVFGLSGRKVSAYAKAFFVS